MEEDKTFYKQCYQDTWEDGNKRELIVQSLLESWGFEVETTGFMALSTEFNPASPPEKAIPDFAIYNNINEKIWIEVTGTNNMGLNQKIWIRPDKVDYAKAHRKEGLTYIAHVVTSSLLVRFIDITNIIENTLQIVRPYTHNHQATFYAIPYQNIISREKMKSRLMGRRNRRI